jgi:hypothetical protein
MSQIVHMDGAHETISRCNGYFGMLHQCFIHVACNIRLVRLEYTFMIVVAQVKSRCCSISMFMFQVFFMIPMLHMGKRKV